MVRGKIDNTHVYNNVHALQSTLNVYSLPFFGNFSYIPKKSCCDGRNYRHYSGNRHYSAYCHGCTANMNFCGVMNTSFFGGCGRITKIVPRHTLLWPQHTYVHNDPNLPKQQRQHTNTAAARSLCHYVSQRPTKLTSKPFVAARTRSSMNPETSKSTTRALSQASRSCVMRSGPYCHKTVLLYCE